MNDLEKTAILIVSIASSNRESGSLAASAVEKAIAQQFPNYELRKALARQRVKVELDPVCNSTDCLIKEALDQAVADGIQILIVQPTFLMHGFEYKNLIKLLRQYEKRFQQLMPGEPLLTSEADFEAVRKAITKQTADYNNPGTAICFVGHGRETDGDNIYKKMQNMLLAAGYQNYYIGAIKAEPSLEDVKKALQAAGCYQRVVLYPFMTAAGNHAYRDIAGEQNRSWKRALEQAGYEVVCVLEGLGQIPAVQEVFAAHVRDVLQTFV